MKKAVSFVLLLACLLCFALTGCHSNPYVSSFTIPDELTAEPLEITFWAKNDSNAAQAATYRKAIADFQALYPNITVKMVSYVDYSRIYNDVITNISTGTTPNVCITYPDHIATYNSSPDVVVSLDALMANPKYGLGGSELKFDGVDQGELVPKFLEECKLDGKYYAMPFMRSTEACYVNVDMVESLGFTLPEVLTWDFVFEVSERAMEKNADGSFKANGQSTLIPLMYKSTDNMMISMLKQKDAGYSTDLGEIKIFNDTTDELLLDIAKIAEQRAFSTFKISSYPGNYFNRAQCIFAIDSTAGATWMGGDAPNVDVSASELVDFEVRVMTIPQYDTENPKMISQGPSMCVFNKENAQEVLASWLFVQFLLTNEVQIAYSATEGYCPVTTKAQQSDEYKEYLSSRGIDDDHYAVKIDATRLLLDNVDNTFVTPVFNGSASLRNAAGQLIEEVTKAERRGDEVDKEYLEEVYERVTSLNHLRSIDTEAPLPKESVILLLTLALVWCGIGGFMLYERRKKKKT